MEFRAFFVKCGCEDDVKKVYRGLAMAHHPDKGGTAERFQILQEEYQYQLRRMAPGYTYAERTSKSQYTYGDEDYSSRFNQAYENVFERMRKAEAERRRQEAKTAKSSKFLRILFGTILTVIFNAFGVRVNIKY